MIGIYSFENKINGKRYVGQSVNIEARHTRHLSASNNSSSDEYNKVLYKAFRKYGVENFSFSILEEVEKENLNQREIFWIEHYDAFLNGYNATPGGDGGNGLAGEKHYNAILTTKQVLTIKDLLKSSSLLQSEIAKQFNVKDDVISLINTGKNWRSVGSNDFPIRKKKPGSDGCFSNAEVTAIRKRYVVEEAAVIYKDYKDRCALSTFRGILSGSAYKHLPIYKKRQKRWV